MALLSSQNSTEMRMGQRKVAEHLTAEGSDGNTYELVPENPNAMLLPGTFIAKIQKRGMKVCEPKDNGKCRDMKFKIIAAQQTPAPQQFTSLTRLPARARPCSAPPTMQPWGTGWSRKRGFLSYRTRYSGSLRIDAGVPAFRLFRRLSVPIESRPNARGTYLCLGPGCLS